jgi:hypothetical protein
MTTRSSFAFVTLTSSITVRVLRKDEVPQSALLVPSVVNRCEGVSVGSVAYGFDVECWMPLRCQFWIDCVPCIVE